MRRLLVLASLPLAAALAAAALAADERRRPARPPTLIAAGDIASCGSRGDEATARLLDRLRGTVVTLGDNAYENGSDDEFARCYAPSWGRAKARTRPAPGNHDYRTSDAAGYFRYFGRAAGDPARGYYSYRVGTWRLISLNSNCGEIGGCDAGSPQERWLRRVLRGSRARCTLAYWHHPRFSSGPHGSDRDLTDLWRALHQHRADVVLGGHDHTYERFAPQDPDGRLDRARGIRQFVVGTGGKSHYSIDSPIPNSEVHNDDTFGVLVLTLRPAGYDWRFVPEAGKTFADRGSGRCR